jgi:hypothetical protein
MYRHIQNMLDCVSYMKFVSCIVMVLINLKHGMQ